MWCRESWRAACKSMKLEHTLTPCTKISSKWLQELEIRHDTIKLLEQSMGKTFSDINHTNVFLGQFPKAIEIKTKRNKWDLIKLTSFCTVKETIKKKKKRKDKLQSERKYVQMMLLTRAWPPPKYTKRPNKSTTKKIQLKKGQKTLIDISPQKIYRWPAGTWKYAQYHY